MGRIEIQDLSLVYRSGREKFLALDNINTKIDDGEFVCIVGSSGCGKSTLLGVLEGLLTPTGGRVLIDGKPIHGTGPERAVVFQQYTLFPWMSAIQNVVFGVKQVRRELSAKQLEEIGVEFLQKVGLKDFLHKRPGELSGGMQQRVAIARALAVNPQILLMDEPFGAIDAKTRLTLQEMLLNLWAEDAEKKTVVFVTHDIDEAILLSDKILFMEPKRISREIPVTMPRPRDRDSMYDDKEFRDLRNNLVILFYKDIKEQIGGEEVML
ncbi:MAG: ABC transporter ATP-binding protein [Clostridiales Family XIII bacterium]|jgi:NitT/TauT family transport system ATP-binding protein|nr:ABC transporter ATP-binding protein [Clostridiales Family XIII bacterium]